MGYNSKYTGLEVENKLDAIDGKQDTLISGTNIKTINGESILGIGNINAGVSESYVNEAIANAITTTLNTAV